MEDYLKRLFPEQNQETEQPMSDDEAGAAAIYDQSRLLWDKVEQGDADAKADVDAIVLRMQEALQECEDAFGTDAEMRMAEMQDNPWAHPQGQWHGAASYHEGGRQACVHCKR